MVAVIAFLFLLSPVFAGATTYYVATTGSNSNNGTSESTPYLTIKKCVDTMVAGDTCYVRGGTYNETVIQFKVTGTQAAPIQLLNYPNELPVIDFNTTTGIYRILFQHASGLVNPLGWITVAGFEIKNGYEGMKFHNLHDAVIRNNWIHHNRNQGLLGNGTRILFERNIISHNGRFATAPTSALEHGLYANGADMIVRNNLFYDNLGYGIQLNGSSTSSYNPTKHAGPEYGPSHNWIIERNTFAYESNRAGIVHYGGNANNTRIENNIFYENAVNLSASGVQGVEFYNGAPTGVRVRNNHFYASGSGGLTAIGSTGTFLAVEGVHYTQSGNVVNVSAPAFVNGGSNSLPASPDFRLTARAPVNIALATEFPTNGVVGAFQPPSTPTASISTNKITVVLPFSTATPIQNLSTAGVTFACTANVCPGSPAVSSVSRATGTNNIVEILLSGITSDACLVHADAVTVSYAPGAWTGNDNIGPYPGLHQKILSFTNLSVTNQCTGSGPPVNPGTPHIYYKFLDGSGTNANDESANNLDGTLTNGPTWASASVGGPGVVTTGNNTEHVAVPYGNGINPSTQSLTIVLGVTIPAGNEALARQYIGTPLGSSQRLYISQLDSTFRLGIQGSNDAATGNIAVTAGNHNLCLTMNSATDTATLYVDGVASTAAGAVKSYTSYTLAGDFDIGRIADQATGGAGGTYRYFVLYTSVEDCATISAALETTPPPATTGTFTQDAVQFQGVVLDQAGSPIIIGVSQTSIEVSAGGGAVLLFQVHCDNIADCDQTAFKLVFDKNSAGVWQQISGIETSDGTWMWGASTALSLNTVTRSTRLTGSCAVTTGSTQVTIDQVPVVDLPQDGCVVMAYVVRVGAAEAGNYFDYKLRKENNADLDAITQTARLYVVNPMASGIGF